MIARNEPAPVSPSLSTPLVVTIPGEPKAQGRGRAVRFGSSVRVIDPESSRSWKGAAQVHMLAARQAARLYAPLDVALVVEVDAYWQRPKSIKRSAPHGRLPRPSRPDGDNVGKCVCDAANGILFVDDALVVELVVRKWIAAAGEGPRVEITIREWASANLEDAS